MQNSKSDSYAAAGVDVTAGYESVERIKPHIASTYRPGVLGSIGGFGGLFEPDLKNMKRPIAVSGVDGVGTKLKIAMILDKHDTIGVDCVAMCVNDVICTGAEPLFFLDYLAMGRNDPERTEKIVSGIAEGCRLAGCALIGGETAEHPGMMDDDEYDVAGFALGFVDFENIIDGKTIAAGDILIGLRSSGLHSNGYSLVRKILSKELRSLDLHVPDLGCTLGEELLRPTRIYVKTLLGLIKRFGKSVKGISHITGGGYYENIPRMLPGVVRAEIDVTKIPVPPIFDYLMRSGTIPVRDMYNTFNMGVGLVMAVGEENADNIVRHLTDLDEDPILMGRCVKGQKGVDIV